MFAKHVLPSNSAPPAHVNSEQAQQNRPFSPATQFDPEWRSLLRAMLDQRNFPVYLLRPDMKVYVANSRAERATCPIISETQKLVFERFSDTQRFSEMARKALNCDSKEAWAGQLMRVDTDDKYPLVISVSSFSISMLAERGSSPETTQKWLSVSIKPAGFPGRMCPKRIAAAFAFTPAEANLATALAEGLLLQDYAARENVKISTVRWHLQNIFERTGARSQAQLIAMITALVVQ